LKHQVELAEPPYATKSTYEYNTRIPDSVDAVVKVLERTRSLTVDPTDVLLTNGALSALSLSHFVLGDPGDEAIFLTPAYFFYAPII
jgi:aspartate aminotransferase